jgi:hypothetical protein
MSTQQMLQVIVNLQDMDILLKEAKEVCQKLLKELNTQRIIKKKEENRSESETQFLDDYDMRLFETRKQFDQLKLSSSENIKQAIYRNDGKVRTLTNVQVQGPYTMALEVESNKTKRFYTDMLVYV